ncbi:MAG: hypothetical protein WAO83_01925 [Fuerstiella sp.]
MTPFQLQLDSLNEHNLPIMQAYAMRAATQKASVENFDGWLERINELENFAKEDLTKLHGQLIALGFLQFEISSSNLGLRYQISTKGKQALEKALAKLAGTDDEDESTTDYAEAA